MSCRVPNRKDWWSVATTSTTNAILLYVSGSWILNTNTIVLSMCVKEVIMVMWGIYHSIENGPATTSGR